MRSCSLQPVEAHVDAFRQARCDGLVGQAHCDLVVTQEQGGGLWVSEVVKDETLVVGETSGSEEGGVLVLLGGLVITIIILTIFWRRGMI